MLPLSLRHYAAIISPCCYFAIAITPFSAFRHYFRHYFAAFAIFDFHYADAIIIDIFATFSAMAATPLLMMLIFLSPLRHY